jgi:ketosteroid isomerase-like protein
VDDTLALARRFYELWNEGGPDGMATICAPDMVFHEMPEFPDTDVFQGVDAFTARGRDLVATMGRFTFEVRSLEGSDPWVLAELRLHTVGPRSGVAGDAPYFHVFRFEGGLVAEMRSYGEPDEARREYERLSEPR